ncbi:hypothetical protein ACGFI4_08860 [Micromonospora carbonacea]|uniref:Uncharacterized protein n=2 Tax=Micromonospora TaxID=1873 RepID=A0A0D0X849_9ACTN|nr:MULTISPECIES: hypothetical protein [Micromonospora]MDI5942662.1 hypothetical protein [Micromonospora sp. DH15]KIR65610.1 hypothetical protein TK50_09555 [Micromonospora haikouensis]MBB5828067.1 hypothetical protein [Micromonospora carbonacea]MDG4817996.1 hypothetical protein [Micromonospora sp. WMMD956]OON31568.1 hypothetical protein BSA16_10160 [Micromonospora sp. Rc5]
MEHPSELSVAETRAWERPVVTVPVLVCLSLVGGQLPSFSASANLYTLGTGGALIWLGLGNRVPRRPAPRRLGAGAVWWVLPVAVFGVFEGVTFVLAVGDEFPTFSRLADPLLEDELVRSAAWFAWLAAFWGLVRR